MAAATHRFSSSPQKRAPHVQHLQTANSPSSPGLVSPPSSHPFLRPAIQATPSPVSSLHGSRNSKTSYYYPLGTPHHGDSSSARAASVASTATSVPSRKRPPSAPPAPSYSVRRGIHVKLPADLQMTTKEEIRRSKPIPPRKLSRWEEKVQGDLAGWRGGKGTPRSSVPQPGVTDTYFGQPRTGIIGRDLPKEIVRVQRVWHLKDVAQFSPQLPLELEGRVGATAFNFFIEAVNLHLREAYSTKGAVVDNVVAVLTWWTSLLWRKSHFETELRRAEEVIKQANEATFNPAGLNVLSPRTVALQYLEIEYY